MKMANFAANFEFYCRKKTANGGVKARLAHRLTAEKMARVTTFTLRNRATKGRLVPQGGKERATKCKLN